MALYVVKVTHIAVVAAPNETAAVRTADMGVYDIVADSLGPAIEVTGKVTSIYDLPDGWHADDLPIGDERTIGEILA